MANLLEQYLLASVLTAILTFFLAVLVSWKNYRRKLNILYSFWACTVALWSLMLVFNVLAKDHGTALLCVRLLHFWAILLPAVYVHFVLLFLCKDAAFNALIKGTYAFSFLLIALNFSPWFLSVEYREKFRFFAAKPLAFYPIHIAMFIACVCFAIIQLYLSWRKAEGSFKRQIWYFLLATLIGYSGGITNYLINYNILIYPLYPFGNFTICAYVIVIGFGILKYQLMDISVIIKRTVVFTGLFGILMAVVGIVTTLAHNYLGQFIGIGQTTRQILSILIAMLLADPIRKLLVNLTDRFLFQKKYNYHKLLKDASRGMSNIESLEHLLGLVVHFVTMKMRVKNASVLMRDIHSSDFNLVYQRGYDKKFLSLTLNDEDPLIDYIGHHKEAVDIERIKEKIEAARYGRKDKKEADHWDYEAIRDRMIYLQATCCVPSFLGRELKNILMLGEKKSGEHYSTEDLNLLYTLAQESAIAIENARLYDEAKRRSLDLEQINDQLERSRGLLERALNEAEGANKQLQDAQAQLIHEQKMATLGRLAASVGHEVNNPLTILSMNVSRAILKYRKDPDLKVSEIMDVFDKMEKNIERIKAVVNTLTGLLKKSEKGKFEPLSLKLILEETLPLVQFQTYLDNLSGTEVDFNVPGNIPLIRGDLERLQEVFLNMFINAYHAMAGKRHRKIAVRAEIDQENQGMVAIHFTDNGCGMTEEVRKKIFNYGFTTKPSGKGSGLGLYMCKYIIELHGGTVLVKSRLGEGTTFTLTLPVYGEDFKISS
ncbi:MAG: Sensor protein ZraS [Candidatus Omnitrophica bacterium ADurb.Bin277]|nr:MAG: Sensor protein ZraS [Candidatus Omnitrophica bacterium ADurb.Bin277]